MVEGEISPEGILGDFFHLNKNNCLIAMPKNSSDPLCLDNNCRFKVEADWRDRSGFSGQATHIKLTGESGAFFLGDADDKIYIRVLDNCAVINNYWVFFAATTDVEFTLKVTDTSAFATCP